MNLPDLLIIYLACGAPFGVYYFLQNRNRIETKVLLLRSVIGFIFWIPFAAYLVARSSLFTKLYKNGFDHNLNSDAKNELKIEEIKKYFESNLQNNSSIYNFREIFDRYVGLSLELKNETNEILSAEQEIFRITNHANKKIGEVCLNRRNRTRLSFHQKLARRDFLQIFAVILEKSGGLQNHFKKAFELVDTVRDSEAQEMLKNLSEEFLQTQADSTVRNWEKETWEPERHKPFTDKQISTNMQIMTATANLSSKD